MYLRVSNIPLRQCLRNLHRQNVLGTHFSVNKVNINSLNYRVISKPIANSRYFCSEKPDVQPEAKRVTITFKKSNGVLVKRQGTVGEPINELIAQDDREIPGFGVCGGTLSCSTCHVIFTKEDYDAPVEKTTEEELDLLDYAPDNCKTSRLSCCIRLTEEMDGMVLRIPALTKDQRDEFSSR